MMIKIIGCGNSIASDDGVGVYTVRKLRKEHRLPKNIEVVEAGTDIFHFIDLLCSCDKAILVDAVLGNYYPGKIHKLTKKDISKPEEKNLSLHQFDISSALSLAEALYPEELPDEIRVFGIEIEEIVMFQKGLSKAVEDSIPHVINDILKEIKLMSDER